MQETELVAHLQRLNNDPVLSWLRESLAQRRTHMVDYVLGNVPRDISDVFSRDQIIGECRGLQALDNLIADLIVKHSTKEEQDGRLE